MIGIAQISPMVRGAAALIRGREIDERLQIEAARGVGDELARERVDTRISRQGTVGELGKFQIVLARQVLPDLADLILDDVVIVPEPVLRSDGRRPLRDGCRQEAVRIVELLSALVETWQQRPATDGVRRQAVQARECDRVPFEPVLTKELRFLRTGFVNEGIRERRIDLVSQRRGHPLSL